MALKTEYTCPREGYAQKRILSRAFGNATPARIAGDIDHGRKRPTESRRIGFLRRDASRTLRQRGIPTTGFRQRNRKDGAIAVNNIEAKQIRNLQPGFFDGHALQLVRALRAAHVECRAQQPFAK